MELEWLKKKVGRSPEQLRALIEADHPELSVRRQCELLGLSRSSLYYEPAAGDGGEPAADAAASTRSTPPTRSSAAGG